MLNYAPMKSEQDTTNDDVNEDVILAPEGQDHTDDVTFEAETDADMVGGKNSFSTGGEESQVQKLKKKLKEAQEQAKENLDGWQRLKADNANTKQAEAGKLKRAKSRGAEDVLESLLPALDSFDSAMQGEAWEAQDDAWRMGMEFVHTQLVQALEGHGVVAFGTAGDAFDTAQHEAAEGDGSTVAKVLRKGYKSKEGVIRPARVVVGE